MSKRRNTNSNTLEPQLTTSSSITRTHTLRGTESSVRGRYHTQQQHYLQHDFTTDCSAYITKICNSCSAIEHLKDLPMREATITVCRMLMLNELELLFLHGLLQSLQWNLDDELIVAGAAELRRFQPSEKERVKQMHVYLLLAAYSVKVYLNDNVKMFEGELTQLLPSFLKIFGVWGSKYAKSALTVNPKRLNKLYLDNSHPRQRTSPPPYEDLNEKVANLVDTMPIPDPDSMEEEMFVKVEGPLYVEVDLEIHDEIQFDHRASNRRHNDENFMIDDMPMPLLPFRGDSVVSVASGQWQWHNDLDNLPLPLTKRRSLDSEHGLQ